MSRISTTCLNHGILIDQFKLKERQDLFDDLHFYFTNYIPDAESGTIYVFDDYDTELVKDIFGNVKIYEWTDLYGKYTLHFKPYVTAVKNVLSDMNEWEKLNDLQEVLNEWVMLYDFVSDVDAENYTVLSNSFRFYHEPVIEPNSFYHTQVVSNKNLLDIGYSFYNFTGDLETPSKKTINNWRDHTDYDAERLRYDILTDFGLTPVDYNLKKRYHKNFKIHGIKPRLNKIKTGCRHIIKEMHDL